MQFFALARRDDSLRLSRYPQSEKRNWNHLVARVSFSCAITNAWKLAGSAVSRRLRQSQRMAAIVCNGSVASPASGPDPQPYGSHGPPASRPLERCRSLSHHQVGLFNDLDHSAGGGIDQADVITRVNVAILGQTRSPFIRHGR
jgi:hypothetical protein